MKRILISIFTFAALLVWSLGLAAVSLYFAPAGYGKSLFFSYFSKPLILLLTFLPVLLLTLFFFFLFNRLWAAVLAGGAIVLALTFTNYIKLMLRDDPVLATDLHYISEAAGIGGRYNITLIPLMWICFAAVALANSALVNAATPAWSWLLKSPTGDSVGR